MGREWEAEVRYRAGVGVGVLEHIWGFIPVLSEVIVASEQGFTVIRTHILKR